MISPRLSAWLDLLRFAAALIVLLSHFAYERFTDGAYLIIREFNLGSDAVVIFFVLSGFVIAHTSRVKDRQLGQYLFNRGTRIWSVAIPAILLTFILDRCGAMLAPELYAGWWYNPASILEMLAIGLTFSNEWTLQGFRPGTNGPYWSLSYEVAYYILFGVAFYLSGFRRYAWLTVAVLIFGIKIIALAPAWLMGVYLYHRLNREPETHENSRPANDWLWATVPAALYLIALAIGLPNRLLMASALWLSPETVVGLRFSDEFLWNALVGLLFASHLFGAARLMQSGKPNPTYHRCIKWLAGASFSIYLVHYPVLQFLDAVLPEFSWAPVRHAALLVLTLLVCFGFAQMFERKLGAFREYCTRHLERQGFDVRQRKESAAAVTAG